MNDNQLERYSRQTILPQVGIVGQEKLLNSTALIIGVGGLGSATSMYLASSGIGHLIIADFDIVELSNLQRQVIHFHKDIGELKVDSAAEKLSAINPDIKITKLSYVDEEILQKMFEMSDIVLDGSDNFETRFLLNKFSVNTKTPLVSAAVIGFEGQVSVYKGWLEDKPCYRCLYDDRHNEDNNCSLSGVIPPAVAIVAGIQSLQTIKVLLDLPQQLVGKLLLFDALETSFRTLTINKDYNCKVCF